MSSRQHTSAFVRCVSIRQHTAGARWFVALTKKSRINSLFRSILPLPEWCGKLKTIQSNIRGGTRRGLSVSWSALASILCRTIAFLFQLLRQELYFRASNASTFVLVSKCLPPRDT